MEIFEYAMVLVSIVIGLAITHVLSAAGATIHRLRGHGDPIRLEPVFLFWVGYVLTWLVGFWWWEFKFQEVHQEWTFALYLFVVTYAIGLFLLTVILIPNRMEEVRDTYEYLMEGRKWFFGAALLVTGFDVADTILKGNGWGLRPEFLVLTGVTLTTFAVGIVTERRSLQLAAAMTAFFFQQLYMFKEVGIF